jgi:tRNA U34 5-methylaminomethyl-2-thiouridine-forming methyltransferase MnmC
MHLGLGPDAEAELLYVRQLKIRERMARLGREFVIWDVGLGAAANVLAALRATRDLPHSLHLVSFDNTLEPLAFALDHSDTLGYLHGYEAKLEQLLAGRMVEFTDGAHQVRWQVQVDDFPTFVAWVAAESLPKPDAIFFDAFSPARNPGMWTLPVFENLFRLLDPARPCALATYSRSTLVRVAMLLGGFFVGRGRPSGVKEETTVAANRMELLDEPLNAAWLQRARCSGSAEPLRDTEYRQLRLSEESWARLKAHPQFVSERSSSGCESPQPTHPGARR